MRDRENKREKERESNGVRDRESERESDGVRDRERERYRERENDKDLRNHDEVNYWIGFLFSIFFFLFLIMLS